MPGPVRGVLLDIEGTTTPIAFVYDVLFPYARTHLAEFLRSRWGTPEMAAAVEALREQHRLDLEMGLKPPPLPLLGVMPHSGVSGSRGDTSRGQSQGSRVLGEDASSSTAPPPNHPSFTEPPEATNPMTYAKTANQDAGRAAAEDVERTAVEAYLVWLMDNDRKVPALKSIQGKIWEEGYRSGALKGQVFDDVPPFLRECRDRRIETRIFSSGSVLAQRLLFANSEAGDLSTLLGGYYDTGVGPKSAPESYVRIASDWGLPASVLVFVSDVAAELDAAFAAGLGTRLCIRPGNPHQPPSPHATLHGFGELTLNP